MNHGLERLKWRGLVLEIGLLLLYTLLFGSNFLNFDPNQMPMGGEFQNIITLREVLVQALNAGQFPLWNPLWHTGQPYVADPFFFLFDPFTSIPVWLLGIINGAKVEFLINFFLIAFGGWLLAYSLGLRAIVRVWAGMLLLSNGKLASIVNTGLTEYISAFPWLVMFLALLILLVRTRQKRYIVLAAVSWALLYLSGFLYYFLFSIPCLIIIAAFTLVDFRQFRFSVDWKMARSFALIAVMLVGLLAVRLVPEFEIYPRLQKGGTAYDPDLNCSQSVNWSLTNFLIKDAGFYPQFVSQQGGVWFEFYSYMGVLPFAGLLFVIPAFRSGRRRWMLIIGALFLFAIMYATPRYNFFLNIYHFFPVLLTLACPVRIYALETIALIMLAGFGVDYLFDVIARAAPRLAVSVGSSSPQATYRSTVSLSTPLYGVVLLMLLFSLRDVYAANRVVGLFPVPERDEASAQWLRQHDQSLYYVMTRDPFFHRSLYDERIPTLNPFFAWELRHNPDTSAELGKGLRAGPKYSISPLAGDFPLPNHLLQQLPNGDSIYEVSDVLPVAFVTSRANLEKPVPSGDHFYMPTPASAFPDMRSAEVELQGTNRFVLRAQGDAPTDMLVLEQDYFPGWELTIDGQPAPIERVSWYMGVMARPGTHTYVFEFHSHPFEIGLVISLLTVLGMVAFLFLDTGRLYARVLSRLRSFRHAANGEPAPDSTSLPGGEG